MPAAGTGECVTEPPSVSVIVPARDAESTIGRCLGALARQTLKQPYEVVVVDDGSKDGTRAAVRAFGSSVRLVEQRAMGPAAARNAGVRVTSGAILAFTDADCEPARGWLAAGVHALGRSALVQGAVLPDPRVSPGPFDRTLRVTQETGLYELANVFLHRRWFERVGGLEAWLDQGDGKELAEDVWLGWRIRRAGGSTAFCPEAVVYHAVFPRGPRGFLSERRRLQYFPAIARRIPELRREAFFGRLFLTRRTAAFDAAVTGCIAARFTTSRWPLALALPYLFSAGRRCRPWRRNDLRVALVKALADSVGLVALLRGSLRERTPVM